MAIKRARTYDDLIDDDFDFDESIVEDDESFEFIRKVNLKKKNTENKSYHKNENNFKGPETKININLKKTVKRNRSITLSELGTTYDSSQIVKYSENIIKQSDKPKDQDSEKTTSTILKNNNDIGSDWVTKYTPHDIKDISIHSRKIKEVKDKLKEMINGTTQCRILILKGPCGTGKSTLVKLLAKELLPESDVPLIEYLNPHSINQVSHVDCFKEFLKSVRYRQGTQNCSIVLIEDLPFLFHEPTKTSFQDELYNWLFYETSVALPPLVFCINEFNYENYNKFSSGLKNRNFYLDINSNYSVETIFGFKILKEYKKVFTIKFNPINKTLMKKTLQKIINLEKIKLTTDNTNIYIDKLINCGDLRSSILSLQFLSLLSNHQKGHLMLDIGKESQMDLFHLIGRLVFGTQKLLIEKLLTNLKAEQNEKQLVHLTYGNAEEENDILFFNNQNFKDFNFMLPLNFQLSNEIIKENSYLVSKLTFMNLFLIENYNMIIKTLISNIHNDISRNKFLKFLDNISIIDILEDNEIRFQLTVRNSRCYLNYNENFNKGFHIKYDKHCHNNLNRFLSSELSVSGKESNTEKSLGYTNKLNFPRDFKYLKKKLNIEKVINFQRLSLTNSTSFEDIALYQGYYEALINKNKLFKFESLKYTNASINNEDFKSLEDWATNVRNILVERPGDDKFDTSSSTTTQNEMYDDDNNNSENRFNNNNLFDIASYYKNYLKNVIEDQFSYSSEEFSEDIDDDTADADEFEEILSDSDLDNFI